jgi:hypothetical protein
MAVNVMDTAVQLTRASIAGGYGVASMFSDEDLDVRKVICTTGFTKGIKLKSNNTSMSREAMQDGFWIFRSGANYHRRCSADCISWWTWTSRCKELLMADFLSGFTKAQNKAAEMSVRY